MSSDDIVKRRRNAIDPAALIRVDPLGQMIADAADEIERLKAENNDLRQH